MLWTRKGIIGTVAAVAATAGIGVTAVAAQEGQKDPTPRPASQAAIDSAKQRFSVFEKPGSAASGPSARTLRNVEGAVFGPGDKFRQVKLARKWKGQSIYLADGPGKICVVDELDSGLGGSSCVGEGELGKLVSGELVTTLRTDTGIRVFAPVPDGTGVCTATLKSGQAVSVPVEGNIAVTEMQSAPTKFSCDGAAAATLPDFDREVK